MKYQKIICAERKIIYEKCSNGLPKNKTAMHWPCHGSTAVGVVEKLTKKTCNKGLIQCPYYRSFI
jgi:hypothetical protein